MCDQVRVRDRLLRAGMSVHNDTRERNGSLLGRLQCLEAKHSVCDKFNL